MNLDNLDLERFEIAYRAAVALKANDMGSVNELAADYVQAKVREGAGQQAALDDFKAIIKEALALNQQEVANEMKAAEDAEEAKKSQLLMLVAFALDLLLAIGVFFLVRDAIGSSGGDAALAAFVSFVSGFQLVSWLVINITTQGL